MEKHTIVDAVDAVLFMPAEGRPAEGKHRVTVQFIYNCFQESLWLLLLQNMKIFLSTKILGKSLV